MSARTSLLGKSDRELRMIAGDATHQHYNGGLYRLMGPVFSAKDGEPLSTFGEEMVLYEHCAPYARRFWVRDKTEFHGLVVTPYYHPLLARSPLVKRFRELGTDWY